MGRRIEDLTGMVFGKLKVKSFSHTDKNALWNCVCECGKTKKIRANYLKNGISKSCGCLRESEGDLSGQRFGNLVVKSFSHRDENYRNWWLCRCDCGNEKIMLSHSFKRGITKTCGCRLSNRMRYFVPVLSRNPQ